MLRLPDDLYCDVRFEDIVSTSIRYRDALVEEVRTRPEKGALIRMFDGEMWYYESVDDPDRVQEGIDRPAALAAPTKGIEKHPVARAMEGQQGRFLRSGRYFAL